MDVIDRLDKYLLEHNPRERTSHHPSDVDSCLRQMYYKWNGVEKSNPPTAGAIIKMRFGNLAEDIVKGWLYWERDHGIIKDFQTQVEVTGIEEDLEYPIHGYQDFVLETPNGNKIGIECKSSYGMGIKNIQREGKPKPEHLLQVYQYMRYGEPKRYYLIYIGRDNGYRTCFTLVYYRGKLLVDDVEYPIDWNHYLNRLIAAEHTKGAAIIPDRDFRAVVKDGEIKPKIQRNNVEYKSDWQCSYCDWKDLCWKKEINRSRETGHILYGGDEI